MMRGAFVYTSFLQGEDMLKANTEAKYRLLTNRKTALPSAPSNLN